MDDNDDKRRGADDCDFFAVWRVGGNPILQNSGAKRNKICGSLSWVFILPFAFSVLYFALFLEGRLMQNRKCKMKNARSKMHDEEPEYCRSISVGSRGQ
jgi:hypothetical protein